MRCAIGDGYLRSVEAEENPEKEIQATSFEAQKLRVI